MVEHGAHGYSSFGVTLRLIVFVFWPFMIFWTLAAIVFGDPGVIDKKFIDKLYAENKIEADKIGVEYTMKEVIEMLTENYLVRQSIMKPSQESLGRDAESLHQSPLASTVHTQQAETPNPPSGDSRTGVELNEV